MSHRNRPAPILAAGLLALVLQGCGASEDAPAPAPAEAPAAAPEQPAAPAEPAPAPVAPVEPAAAPAGDAAKSLEAGRMSYTVLCASCHGATGAADTPVAAALDPRPAAHNDGNYMNALSDDYLFQVIKEGGAAVGKSPLMAPWGGSLSDDQIRNVVLYVRSLADPPYTGGD